MTWYVYHQNNSKGVFTRPALFVAVEAPSSSMAWKVASRNGVDRQAKPYCPCCGERWSDYASESDGKPGIAGDDGVFSESFEDMYREWAKRDQVPLALYIHADGTKEEVMP